MPLIRKFRDPEDRAPLLALLRRCGDYAWLERGRHYDVADAVDIRRDALDGGAIGPGLRFVLEGPSSLDGIAALEFGFPTPRDAYITLLLLAPEARGQGHGARMLGVVLAEARARGCPAIHASVLDANLRGRAFWARQGFMIVWTAPRTVVGRRRHVYHRLRLVLE